MSSANSANAWRQAPHGAAGGLPAETMAMARNRLFPSAAARTFLEQRFPPESWARMPEPKLALVRARAEALIREDRKGSFGRLAPMLADRKTDPVVAAAILWPFFA